MHGEAHAHLLPCPPTAPAHLQLPLPPRASLGGCDSPFLPADSESACGLRPSGRERPLEGRRQERKAEGKREPQNHCPITPPWLGSTHWRAGHWGCSGLGTSRRQLPLAHPPRAQAEAAASTSSPCVLGHGAEGGVTAEGRTPWPKTRYGQQSPNTQHPNSTPWYRSSRLGHTQQLPPVTLRATAHTHRVSTKDLPGQKAHFLPGRVGLERAVWAAFIPLASIC